MKLFILFSLILSPQGGIPGRDGNLALHSEIVYLLHYAYCILLRATLADTGWWVPGTRPPGSKFSHLMLFSAKLLQKIRLAHPLWELAPLPREIPGSATEQN